MPMKLHSLTDPAPAHRDLFYPPHPMPPAASSRHPAGDETEDVALAPWGGPDHELARKKSVTSVGSLAFPPSEEAAKTIEMYFSAYRCRDRATVNLLLSEDFSFTSPLDRRIDRSAFFQRCWPVQANTAFHIERILAKGTEAFVTYECEREDGTRFRNTAFFILRDDQIRHIHIYCDTPKDMVPVDV